MGQNIVVLAIVAVAIFYLGYITYRSIVGRGKSCGGCGTCPSKLPTGNLVQLDAVGPRKEAPTADTSHGVSSQR